ncbi:Serine/threonine-protein kinase PknB [Pirellulimonas nuda]|uniref:non-specific serine/threonine protein kinase n=2 Tax=Pirellulimonas nuda TaxID=2528009 RepID=A0A518DAF2_9BACT|nr:Serine/threonine-protein kinase PknB [Pirellulimonas nuda]
MEYVDGQSLAEILRHSISLGHWISREQSLRYLANLAEAVIHAHASSILHRDIKPENVIISRQDEAKLTDFGIAKIESQQDGFGRTNNQTVDGARTGTCEYMSPEQLNGKPLDYQSDLFSLGIVAYLLLSKRHPFCHHSGLFSISELISHGRWPIDRAPLGEIASDSVVDVVLKLLEFDPKDRPQSAADLLGAIRSSEVSGLLCPHCGAPNVHVAVFCNQCGRSLRRDTSTDNRARGRAAALTDEGVAASEAGNWDLAVAKYKTALLEDGTYARALGNLGYALSRFGRYDEAVVVLDRAIRLEEHPLCYDYRAFALSKLLRNEEALSSIDKAIAISPQNVNYMVSRAHILLLLGRRNDAMGQLKQVLELDPGNTRASDLRSRIY